MVGKDNVRLLAEMVTEGTDVKIRFGDSWQYNTKEKVLTIPHYKEYYNSEVGVILHEVGHSRFTTSHHFQSRAEHELINALEDRRIEDKMEEVYGGAWKYFDDMRVSVLEGGIGPYLGENAVDVFIKLCAIIRTGFVGKDALRPFATMLSVQKALENWDEIINVTGDTTEELARNAEHLAEIVRELDTTKEAKEHAIKEIASPFAKGLSRPQAKRDNPEKEFLRRITQSASYGERGEMDQKLKESKDSIQVSENIVARVEEEAQKYAKIVGKIKERSYTRFAGGYESGKISTKRLARLFTGKDTKLFTRKIAQRPEDKITYAVLVDVSGSMVFRGALHEALVAGMAFAKACEKAGIPVTLHTFATKRHKIKGLGDRANVFRMVQRLVDHRVLNDDNLSHNCDGKHVQKEYEEILSRPELAKRIVVFSDGEEAPCGDCSGGTYWEKTPLKGVIDKITADGKVRLESIGILSDHVQRLYTRYQLAHKLEDIPLAVKRAFTL